MAAEFKDYYSVLGINKTATDKEIRSAFRKLAAKAHPDRNPDDPGAEDRFKELNEAYTVLSDPEKRRFYDQYGTQGGKPPPFTGGGTGGGFSAEDFDASQFGDFSDFFQNLFGGAFRGGNFTTSFSTGATGAQTSRQQYVPAPVEANLSLDLDTAFTGGDVSISLDGRNLTVTIPAGSRPGQRLRLRGQGPGGADLLLRLEVNRHPVFTLDGDNLLVSVPVPDYRAVLGGEVKVPTITGDVMMSIPAGTRPGRVLRLRGQGWPKKDGTRGDELAEVRVLLPEHPTEEQLELYRQLESASHE